ncbi:MAG: CapA family protein [Treponema sp.]|nr:CapA family protein [Treponema sp.]
MKKSFFLFLSAILFFSCKSLPDNEVLEEIQNENIYEIDSQYDISKYTPQPLPPKADELTLVFGGDIMAHSPNYSLNDYNKIWAGIKDITSDSDFTFGNIEAPVADNLEMSTYPNFNMHSSYVQAAIDSGFNVFSLSNNHSNDKYLEGIKATISYSEKITTKYAQKERKIYFSGLKNGEKDDFSYCIIQKNGWNIVFVAITQLLNRNDYSSYINYVPSRKENKENFIKWCKKLRSENPCDLFILSLHTNEEEYVREVSKKQRNWYNELFDSGIDVIWANHAHIIKHQEKIKTETSNRYPSKLLMCANGNTISAQRTKPNLKSSFTERDDTGDGLLYKVTFRKMPESKKPYIYKTERFFITTYINTAYEYILKKLDQNFIDYLVENRPSWVEYIKKRKAICEAIEDKSL